MWYKVYLGLIMKGPPSQGYHHFPYESWIEWFTLWDERQLIEFGASWNDTMKSHEMDSHLEINSKKGSPEKNIESNF